MTVLYTKIDDGIKWSITEKNLLKIVSERKKCQCSRYHRDIDKILSLYGELLLRYILGVYYNINEDCVIFDYTKSGKPFFNNLKIQFNISHSGSVVVCAVSELGDVGVDIEKIEELPESVVEYCFSHKEKQNLNSMSIDTRIGKFYDIWTRKESYLKYKGWGLIDDMKTINTFDDSIEKYYHTYQLDGYIINIYSEIDSEITFQYMDFNDIRKYFLNTFCEK